MRFWCFLFALVAASPALAQTTPRPAADTRLPVAVLDARGVWARLGQDPITATGLFLAAPNLPSRGFGGNAGAHIYPLRGRSVAFGIGAEGILAFSRYEPVDETTKKPTGDIFKRRLRGVSGQISLNFGRKAGWSYLTAGLGPMSFESYKELTTPTTLDGLRTRTLNFGGGARWFNFDHLAFTLDLRFYRTRAALATPGTAPRGDQTLMIMSAGFAIK